MWGISFDIQTNVIIISMIKLLYAITVSLATLLPMTTIVQLYSPQPSRLGVAVIVGFTAWVVGWAAYFLT